MHRERFSTKKPNKVKRMEKVSFEMGYTERAGMDVGKVEKYLWLCRTCGRVWLMRQDAKRCKHKNYVLYGERKVYCDRKEELGEKKCQNTNSI